MAEMLSTQWESFSVVLAVGVFLAYVFVDALWAYYTLSVQSRRAVPAATAGALMYFVLAFGIITYVQNYLYLIPLVLGSWIGTYLVVAYESKLPAFFKK